MLDCLGSFNSIAVGQSVGLSFGRFPHEKTGVVHNPYAALVFFLFKTEMALQSIFESEKNCFYTFENTHRASVLARRLLIIINGPINSLMLFYHERSYNSQKLETTNKVSNPICSKSISISKTRFRFARALGLSRF